MKPNKIFVSIASYKESELSFVVDTMLQRACNPENLRIVVCQQDDPAKFIDFPYGNVESININYIDSRGCCWARRQVQDRYDDEEYFLQIDSHCVMTEGWDNIVIDQILRAKKQTNNPVVLAAYPSAYSIKNGQRIFNETTYTKISIRPDGLDRYGIWHTGLASGPQSFIDPEPSPYINAGLMFGDGSFMRDCLYDPDLYFNGEELLNTIKAFTHGYDLFNPGAHICWHLYKDPSLNDPGLWTHHAESEAEQQRATKVGELDKQATEKLKRILSGQLPRELGTVRTIADYEQLIDRPIFKKSMINHCGKILIFSSVNSVTKQLIRQSIFKKYDVSVVSAAEPEYSDYVNWIRVDRSNIDELIQALGEQSFDIVIDSISMDDQLIPLTLKAITGKTKQYILTSTTDNMLQNF